MKRYTFLRSAGLFIVALLCISRIWAQEPPEAVPFAEAFPEFRSPSDVPVGPGRFLKNATPDLTQAFTYDRNINTLYFVARTGEKLQQFNLSQHGLSTPSSHHAAWSPDGTQLAISMKVPDKGVTHLYLLTNKGSINRIATVSIGGVGQPTWNAQGTKIAFLKGMYSKSEIWVYDVVKNDSTKIAEGNSEKGNCGNPVWFNTQNELLYKIFQPTSNIKSELWVYDLVEIQKYRLFPARTIYTAYPIVSPNDSLIGFSGGKTFELYSLDGTLVKEFPNPHGFINPRWTNDNEYIVYHFKNIDPNRETITSNHLEAMDIRTGQKHRLTPKLDRVIKVFRWFNEKIIYTTD